MWLDGLYMAEPFYAEYAGMFGDSTAFDDIADQFVFVERHTRDTTTGCSIMHGTRAGGSPGRTRRQDVL